MSKLILLDVKANELIQSDFEIAVNYNGKKKTVTVH